MDFILEFLDFLVGTAIIVICIWSIRECGYYVIYRLALRFGEISYAEYPTFEDFKKEFCQWP